MGGEVDSRPAEDVGRGMLGCPSVGRVVSGFNGADVVLGRCVCGGVRGV